MRGTAYGSSLRGRPALLAKELNPMNDRVYKVIEIVGSSSQSVDDAIKSAVATASKTIRNMGWFEVVQTRGHIDKGSIAHFQVTLKIGFTLEG
jgi:flavin-binding protein dodecin